MSVDLGSMRDTAHGAINEGNRLITERQIAEVRFGKENELERMMEIHILSRFRELQASGILIWIMSTEIFAKQRNLFVTVIS